MSLPHIRRFGELLVEMYNFGSQCCYWAWTLAFMLTLVGGNQEFSRSIPGTTMMESPMAGVVLLLAPRVHDWSRDRVGTDGLRRVRALP